MDINSHLAREGGRVRVIWILRARVRLQLVQWHVLLLMLNMLSLRMLHKGALCGSLVCRICSIHMLHVRRLYGLEMVRI